MRVIQLGNGFRLVLKSEHLGLRGEAARLDQFESHCPIERDLVRLEYDTHASAAQFGENLVAGLPGAARTLELKPVLVDSLAYERGGAVDNSTILLWIASFAERGFLQVLGVRIKSARKLPLEIGKPARIKQGVRLLTPLAAKLNVESQQIAEQ